MVRSSTSPLVWNGVLPRHFLGGAPIRWEFEPGLGAFTSTAGGKPTTHYVKRVAYRDSTIAGTYDGPGGVRSVIVATADPNVVQAHGAWGSGKTRCVPSQELVADGWNGVRRLFVRWAPVRWELSRTASPTSTAGSSHDPRCAVGDWRG